MAEQPATLVLGAVPGQSASGNIQRAALDVHSPAAPFRFVAGDDAAADRQVGDDKIGNPDAASMLGRMIVLDRAVEDADGLSGGTRSEPGAKIPPRLLRMVDSETVRIPADLLYSDAHGCFPRCCGLTSSRNNLGSTTPPCGCPRSTESLMMRETRTRGIDACNSVIFVIQGHAFFQGQCVDWS